MAFRPYKKTISLVVATACLSPLAWAVSPFSVKDVRIVGLQSIEPDMVFARMPIRVGQTFNDQRSREAIQSLFKTGLFNDVKITTQDDVVTVHVQERPVISAITIEGAHIFGDKNLKDGIAKGGLTIGRALDPAILETTINQLKQEYQNQGRYGVIVRVNQTPLPNNRVGLNFQIKEGVDARIKKITLVGNHAFSDSRILDEIKSTTSGWMTWYTGTDKYTSENVEADYTAIRQLYLEKGYLQVNLLPPQVSISPDRKKINLTYTIQEGKQFHVSSVRLVGDLLTLEKKLNALVDIKSGELYRASRLEKLMTELTNKLGEYGYALAKVEPSLKPNEKNQTVDILINIQPNRPIYVRHVNIGGNARTRDVVIRREVRQLESAWYNAKQISLAQARLARLGYFADVQITQAPVSGSNDQIDLNVNVTEKPLGLINVGVGYGSTDKLSFQGSISQSNIFGSGTDLSFSVSTAATNRQFSLTHTDPYFTRGGISRSTSLYYRTSYPYRTHKPANWKTVSKDEDIREYHTGTAGLNMNFGLPLSETSRLYTGFILENNGINIPNTGTFAKAYQDYVQYYGKSNNSLVLTVGWGKDTRNDPLAPTTGYYTMLNANLGVAGMKYYMLSASQQVYLPLSKDFTLAFNAAADYGRTLTSKPYPVLKNINLGGIGSVRGYTASSLGPHDEVSGDYIGGQARLYGNIQLYLPFPGTHNDKTLRWFLFADAGRLMTTGSTICTPGRDRRGAIKAINDASVKNGRGAIIDVSVTQPCAWRYSAGIGLSWMSPIGPLQLSFGIPISSKIGDSVERFQFQMGTAF